MTPRSLGRMLRAAALRLNVWGPPVARTPVPAPLPTTRAELERTRATRRLRLAEADRLLADFAQWDGALRLVRRKR